MSVDAVNPFGCHRDAGTEAPDSQNGPRFWEAVWELDYFTQRTVILYRPA